jgi:hypothetical protein
VVRVKLSIQGCCGAAQGVSDEDRAHPPTPIAMKLGNTGAWQHWVDTELRESLRLRRSCCETAL